jgi:HD-like signal output (HDOD) protein
MIPYRVAQVWNFLRRKPAPEDVAWVRSRLSLPEQAIFFAQQEGDQAHAIIVARTLMEQGHEDERLLHAALLHDAGKAPGVALPYRILVYVLKKVAPGWLESLSPHSYGWMAPLARFVHHPELGADLARAAGCDADVVTLIEYHQRPATELCGELGQMLAVLQVIDDQS